MKIASRCLPVGALPYDNVKHTTAMMAKLFQKAPFVALLPNISKSETVKHRSFENIPGIIYKDNQLVLDVGGVKYKEDMSDLNRTFNHPNEENLSKYCFSAEFLEKYFQMIKKFKSPNAFVNILGPFSFYYMLTQTADKQVLADKSYRKLYIDAVCVKALWIAEKVKQYCPDTKPVVILEEPVLGQFGMLKRENENITAEFITSLLAKVVHKLKEHDILVGVQCLEKCDWKIPIKAGVDLISFDAYNNPNNLGIIPKELTNFLRKGGVINWGIVPVLSDNMVMSLSIDYLQKRLSATISGIIISGVPADLLYESSMVSLNGDTDKLSVMFAEKAIMLADKLGSKLASGIL